MAWSLKKWERGFSQFFTINESDDTAKNVSGYTVTLKVKMADTLLISGTCVNASSTTGYVYYTVTSGDFPYAGKAKYELELVKGTEIQVTETYPVNIGRRI